ncbi:hypothetical protein JB92DRAFT_3116756 [Gautieria morchelliformis]|nr:hypothetical protein JB92DRAFT_3116756 [Gautieria morchelliformis]
MYLLHPFVTPHDTKSVLPPSSVAPPTKSNVEQPRAPALIAAPHVLAEVSLGPVKSNLPDYSTFRHANEREIPYEDMTLPVLGPPDPFRTPNRLDNQNALAGHVEEHAMTACFPRSTSHSHSTLTQHILGYSANPSMGPNSPAFLGNAEAAAAFKNQSLVMGAQLPSSVSKANRYGYQR